MKNINLFLLLLMSIYLCSCHSAKKAVDSSISSIDKCIDESKIKPNKPCTKEFAPVCGCDGETYPNKCYAEKVGVTSWTTGECNSSVKDDLGVGEDCIDPSKMTNDNCTKEYAPVCGCNNVTYSNKCMARNAGLTSWKPGSCK